MVHILFLISLLFLAPSPAFAGKRVALVIGNSGYQHTPPLGNPRNDATDMAVALKSAGLDVIVAFDVDKANFERKIREFSGALSGAEAGVFFYAGHGLQVAGKNYLVPIDAKLDDVAGLDFEMVQLDVIHRSMERQAATNIMFLDACRNNPLARNLARAMGTRSTEIGGGLAPVESGVGTLISFSTQPGNVALDGTGRNSPFAGALIKYITTSDESLADLLIAVRNDVRQATENKQVPWEHSALTGRFYFNPPPPSLTPGAAPRLQDSEAAQAWIAIKDSKSETVLRAFVAKFPETVFAELGRARLKEMESDQTPKVASTDPGPGLANSAQPFDGTWKVVFTAGAPQCPVRIGEYEFQIINGAIHTPYGGSVSPGGDFKYATPSKVNKSIKIRWTGKLSGNTGRGTYQPEGYPCHGTMVLTRQASKAQ